MFLQCVTCIFRFILLLCKSFHRCGYSRLASIMPAMKSTRPVIIKYKYESCTQSILELFGKLDAPTFIANIKAIKIIPMFAKVVLKSCKCEVEEDALLLRVLFEAASNLLFFSCLSSSSLRCIFLQSQQLQKCSKNASQEGAMCC